MLTLKDSLGGTGSDNKTALEQEIADLLVSVLGLPVDPHDIEPTSPLYGEGLGLDSIDLLEVAMEITGRYGFELRSDKKNNAATFASVRSLAQHVEKCRTK
jgi:acyl carrier protein